MNKRTSSLKQRNHYFSTEIQHGAKEKRNHYITAGSFDGAETCELVGLYLLSKLTPVVGNNIALYRDDDLAALNKTPREIENIKKYICKTFNEHNLKLTIEANMKCVNFFDVTLDLNASTYKPFTNLGNVMQYVNRESSHPPSVL